MIKKNFVNIKLTDTIHDYLLKLKHNFSYYKVRIYSTKLNHYRVLTKVPSRATFVKN